MFRQILLLFILVNTILSQQIIPIQKVKFKSFPKGTITNIFIHVFDNAFGQPVLMPCMIARGPHPGPVFAITSTVHGNELNGIVVLHRLFQNLNVSNVHGTIVGIPIVNQLGFLLHQRGFNDNTDINRIFPGKAMGTSSEQFVHLFFNHIVKQFEYLVDLHTASFGRINSYYVRADMKDETVREMARLAGADIILNVVDPGYTLRTNAMNHGIKTITLELQDPHVFQQEVIQRTVLGVKRIMHHLKMIPISRDLRRNRHVSPAKECERSYWMFTDVGGLLHVYPPVNSIIKKGDKVAVVVDVFGKVIKEYFAPDDGIVIGKQVNPVAQTGERILHLGILQYEDERDFC